MISDFAISGNVDHPILTGDILLENGTTDFRRMGIELRGIYFQASTQDHGSTRIALKGRAQSGDGQFEVDGSLTLDADAGWPIEMNLTGTDFELARLPEAQIWISPNLRFIKSKSSQKNNGYYHHPKSQTDLS